MNHLMSSRTAWIGALGLGAALMFVLDPQLGNRRRKRLRDTLRRWSRIGGERVEALAEMTADHAGGITTETQARLTEDHMDDETLTERVRSALGRAVSNPRSIDVWVLDGRVTVCGPVLAQELPSLLNAIKGVRGVRAIDQRLETQERKDGIAGLRIDE